jgi:NAD(P)-dependent dehydrogenase (short-subunit alcohol dehydrogenase family)
MGGMGLAIARRLGSGRTLVVSDIAAAALERAGDRLRKEGYQVVEQQTDVSDPDSVSALAATATSLGEVQLLVHTAGLSPVQAPTEAILRVDLLGAALVLDAFEEVIAPGGSAVFIASMAGYLWPANPKLDRLLATTPTSELLSLPDLDEEGLADTAMAYMVAKRANQVRVQAASLRWGRRSTRINSISPGVIATPMVHAELNGPSGDGMRAQVQESPAGRFGTPQDIAAAVEFLSGPHATFITGVDLLVDGGSIAQFAEARPSLTR